MNETVGFVGLGIMGRPMAGHLAKHYPVLGFDVDTSRLTGLSGVTGAESIKAVAGKCRVVLLSLPNAAIVEQVVAGPDGLAASLAPGSLIIDMSTTIPTVSKRLAETLAPISIEFVDAPVSGGEGGARDASLSIMVGATEELFNRCTPYLQTMGKSVVRVGETGAGGVAKLVNNMIVGATFSVIAEGFALAGKFGIPAEVLYNAIRGGWAGSRVLEVSAPAMIDGNYKPGGTVNIMEKDMAYARTLATEMHVPIPVTAIAHEVFVSAQASGDGPQAQPVIVELWEKLLGLRVASPGGAESKKAK